MPSLARPAEMGETHGKRFDHGGFLPGGFLQTKHREGATANRAWRSHLVEMSAIRGQEASGHWNLWHRILERRKLCKERAPAICMGSVEFWLNIKPCMCRVRLPPGSSYNYQEAVS